MRPLHALFVLVLAGCAAEPRDANPPAAEARPDSAEVQAVGSVCADPARPCPGFRAHDLSFVLPADGVARDQAQSDSFFAVILRSAPACSISEEERMAAQSAFPGRKVFSHRFECDGEVENNVTYQGVVDTLAFLAVYAGRDRPQADSVLAGAAAFPGANLRRVRVSYVYP